MTVRYNRSDQLIGSNWIRTANPERPTVGWPPLSMGFPPRAAHCGQVKDFGGKCLNFREIRLVGPTDHIIKMHEICRETDRILLTSGKE